MENVDKQKISHLLIRYSVPSIIAMLVGSLYNIVDQFFIGRSVGELGNAATSVSFPLSISCLAVSLMFGIGGSAVFSIAMGKSQYDEAELNNAKHYMGNSVTMLFIVGLLMSIITQISINPLLLLFGATDDIYSYSKTYIRIISIGFPFLILSTGGGHLLRADGRPRMTMICNMAGAVINTVLDALFINVLDFGMAGAAWATVIGQFISFGLIAYFIAHTRSVSLELECFIPRIKYIKKVVVVGMSPFVLQFAVMIVQIAMNNSLKYYGTHSDYGATIPQACAGIISKVNMVYMAFIIGISQGLQPIVSFNYGGLHYKRVKSSYFTATFYCLVCSIIAFLAFQIFPRQIISAFGGGNDLYYDFAIRYFRIYLFFTCINFMQLLSSNFFTAIGKPRYGMVLSLSRQILLFLPLIVILPRFIGIDGIMYAGFVSDLIAFIVCAILIIIEFRGEEYKKN